MKINEKWLREHNFSKAECVELAIFAAESVLPIWEADHPNSPGPRKAIDKAKLWLTYPSKENKQAAAACAAVCAACAVWAAARHALAAAACAAWAAARHALADADDDAYGCVLDAIYYAIKADPDVEQAIIDKANEIIKRR